jgi:hypothetical protein
MENQTTDIQVRSCGDGISIIYGPKAGTGFSAFENIVRIVDKHRELGFGVDPELCGGVAYGGRASLVPSSNFVGLSLEGSDLLFCVDLVQNMIPCRGILKLYNSADNWSDVYLQTLMARWLRMNRGQSIWIVQDVSNLSKMTKEQFFGCLSIYEEYIMLSTLEYAKSSYVIARICGDIHLKGQNLGFAWGAYGLTYSQDIEVPVTMIQVEYHVEDDGIVVSKAVQMCYAGTLSNMGGRIIPRSSRILINSKTDSSLVSAMLLMDNEVFVYVDLATVKDHIKVMQVGLARSTAAAAH